MPAQGWHGPIGGLREAANEAEEAAAKGFGPTGHRVRSHTVGAVYERECTRLTCAVMEQTPQAESERPDPFDDPHYRTAVVDILGALAYAELSAFFQMADDGHMAPTHGLKADVAAFAASEFAKYQALEQRLIDIGVDPDEAMAPFAPAIDDFHQRTRPADFLEGLVKAYVGDGIAQDFYRELAEFIDPWTRDFVVGVLTKIPERREFIVATVRSGIDADPRRAGRLALWGRRLVGEAMSQAQQVTSLREDLGDVLLGGHGGYGADLAAIGRMLDRITHNHTRRMERLGLQS